MYIENLIYFNAAVKPSIVFLTPCVTYVYVGFEQSS